MNSRRGVMLIVVLVVVIIAALVGVGALDSGRSIAGAARTGADRAEARAIAMAGVRAYAEELLEQRDALLEGAEASLDGEIELWRDGNTRAIATLLPVSNTGELFVSESGKLGLNVVTAEMLAGLPGVSTTLADAIVTARPDSGFGSVNDLLDIEGVTPELLFGDRERWGIRWEEIEDEPLDAPPALIDRLTVHGADPNVQSGLGEINAEFAGQLRVNLNRPWSEDIERELSELFNDDNTVGLIRQLSNGGAFSDEERFVNTVMSFELDTDDRRGIFDLFTTNPDPYLIGRVDVLRAPEEVLQCVPGLGGETGSSIAAVRATLDEEARRSTEWLLEEGGLQRREFVDASQWLGVRSMQWRVRVRTGIIEDGSKAEDGSFAAPLRHERVTEAVIDLAGPRPRIAFLEDITDRPLIASLIERSESLDEEEGEPLLTADSDEEEEALDQQPRDRRRFGLSGRERRGRGQLDRPRATERVVSETADDAASEGGGAPAPGVDRRAGRWTCEPRRGQISDQEPEP